MSALGVIFAALYAAAVFRGRRAFLLTLGAAAPFNDSAMVSLGPVVVTPFYVGLVVYLVVFAGGGSVRRSPVALPKAPLVLLTYAALVTLLAPAFLGNIGVVASGVGLDEQVGRLTPLSYSASNLAQLAYFLLNIALVTHLFGHRESMFPSLNVAFVVGTVTAFAAYLVAQLGVSWPFWFFDNSPRNFYATIDPRLRAQFSEPSHLGAFTLAAGLFFAFTSLTAKGWTRARGGIFATVCALLIVRSGSGTALIGALAAPILLLVLLASRRFSGEARSVPPAALLVGLSGICALTLTAPSWLRYYHDLVAGKRASASYVTRSYVDHIAYDLLQRSYFVGVGLGSNRASSLLLLLLSTIGIVGTALFGLIVLRSLRNGLSTPGARPAAAALAGLISASVVSYADLASPVLWLLLAGLYALPSGEGPLGSGAIRIPGPEGGPAVTGVSERLRPITYHRRP